MWRDKPSSHLQYFARNWETLFKPGCHIRFMHPFFTMCWILEYVYCIGFQRYQLSNLNNTKMKRNDGNKCRNGMCTTNCKWLVFVDGCWSHSLIHTFEALNKLNLLMVVWFHARTNIHFCPAASKNKDRFKSVLKWLKNNHGAPLFYLNPWRTLLL